MTVNNEKDLGNAINQGEEEIIIEGDLAKKVIRIKATGKTAWIIAIGAVSVALVVVLAALATGPGAPAMGLIATTFAGGAVCVWGLAATVAAIEICVAAGSTTALKKLYKDYKVINKTPKSVTIKRK